MKHIIALRREVSISTSASMFGPAVAMAAEAIERAPDIMMRLRRLQFAERRTILNDLTGVTRDNRDPVRYTRVLSV